MTRFARGWIVASSLAVSSVAATGLFAQQGAPLNNPLRGNQPSAGNVQAAGIPPVQQQPSQQQPVNGQAAGGGQPVYGGQPSYGGQPGAGGQPRMATVPNPNFNGNAPAQNSAGGQGNLSGQPNGVLTNGQRSQPTPLPIAAPFQLTPQERAELNEVLALWEAESDKVRTFSCNFTRLIYDPAWTGGDPKQPKSMDKGEIKYAAPDRGMFKDAETYNFVQNAMTKKWEPIKDNNPGEYWTCSGTSIYTVDYKNKVIEERPLPKELQGKAITDGPLPFVFGAKAAALNSRYFIKIDTPKDVNNQVWLDVYPKFRGDAQNFSRVKLILTTPDMMPYGMEMYDPGAGTGNLSRTVILFEKNDKNNPLQAVNNWFSDFSVPKIPFGGFKHVKVDAPLDQPRQSTPPAQVQNGVGAGQQPVRQAVVPVQSRPR